MGSASAIGEVGIVADACLLTEEGERPIRQIKVGQRLWTRAGWRPARSITRSPYPVPILTVRLANGQCLTAAPAQPLWVKDQGWTPLEYLQAGDRLIPADLQNPKACGSQRKPAPPPVAVVAVEQTRQTAEVWCVEVEEVEECFAGGVLIKPDALTGLLAARFPPGQAHQARRL